MASKTYRAFSRRSVETAKLDLSLIICTLKQGEMKTAQPADWKTEALPSKKTTIHLDRTFLPQEMEHIRRGLVPEQMEDKWFIYWQDDTLFFHRSWTGFCIYVVHFIPEGDRYGMVEADANRDPAQYKGMNDERDARMISYLVEVLLLHREVVFPSDDLSSEKCVVMNWSQVGRAMLGKHPNAEWISRQDALAHEDKVYDCTNLASFDPSLPQLSQRDCIS